MSEAPMMDPRTQNIKQPHNIPGKEVTAQDVIEDTWEKLGRKMAVMRDYVLIRTDIPRRVTEGGLILPDNIAGFYYGMPNVDVPGRVPAAKFGTVIVAGPDACLVSAGDRVIFPRGHFVRHQVLKDESFLGMVREPDIWAVIEPDPNSEGDQNDDIASGSVRG